MSTVQKIKNAIIKHDGWACNKDNFENMFDAWLERTDLETLQVIVS